MQDSPDLTAPRRGKRRKLACRIFMPRRFTPRARERFERERTRALLAHLGSGATISEQIIVSRAVRCEWDLLVLDHRLDAEGELSEHAIRVRGALENRLRLHLRELGLKAPPPSPEEAMARIWRRSRRKARNAAAAERSAPAAPADDAGRPDRADDAEAAPAAFSVAAGGGGGA